AERDVEAERAGRDRLDLQRLALAELHDGALAEGALDLSQRCIEGLVLVLHAFLLDHFQHRRHRHPPVCPTPAPKAAMRISPPGMEANVPILFQSARDNQRPDLHKFIDISSRYVPKKITPEDTSRCS